MKPLVYFDFEEYDADENLVLVEKERLKEILKEVYEAGVSDGSTTITSTPWNNLRGESNKNGFGILCENKGV